MNVTKVSFSVLYYTVQCENVFHATPYVSKLGRMRLKKWGDTYFELMCNMYYDGGEDGGSDTYDITNNILRFYA